MKINIVIPTFKPGNYLLDCLKSLKKQNFKEFVCTLVLNGPQEPFQTQIKKWLKELDMENIKLFYSSAKGVSEARNFALDNNNAEYIAFLDDDDLLNPEYLEHLIKHAHPNCIIQASVYSFYNDNTNELTPDYIGREFKIKNMAECLSGDCPSVFSSCCGKLIPQKLIGSIRFNKTLKLGEDSLFMYNVLAHSVEKVVYTPEATYLRRVRKNSASRKKYSLKEIIKNRVKLAYLFSVVYFSHMTQLNILFYARRIVAIFTKGLIALVRNKG